jgi:hypothetical protein
MTAQPATAYPFKDLPEGTITFLFSDGDSFFVAFPRATNAVAAAFEAQRASTT